MSEVLKYPGLGLPLRHLPQWKDMSCPIGAHVNCAGGASDILPVREVAMMIIMDKLMDKVDWEKKVFDDQIIAKWRKESLEYPDASLWEQATVGKWWADLDPGNFGIPALKNIMSVEAFDYCIEELRNKARYYESSGLIPTLDASATVVKSDRLISTELQGELRNAFDKLKADQTTSPDWHPNSGDMVQDLVHPSMYPLVYGRSRVLQEEVVGVENAIGEWVGKGAVIQKENHQPDPNNRFDFGGVPPSFWSDTYQWLPSNLKFRPDGSVKFTSYVNNLHPDKYPDIYRTIEKLIDMALPALDQCLAIELPSDYEKTGAGRTKSRFSKPENPDDNDAGNWDHPKPEIKQPDPEAEFDEQDWEEKSFEREGYDSREDREWQRIRKPVQRQPDSFNDSADYYTQEESRRLAVRFKNSGLQIIVKMASIELTPEKPEFPAGGWHIEGQMNERICATALYYLDSSNITSNELSFRMQTSTDLSNEYPVGQECYHWLEQVYGTDLGYNASCIQNYGSVETREGRLLAFPNVFQHRVSPFRLTDPSKPGHRRFIALWLVDPHIRIISTANVPPQQLSWGTEAAFSKSNDNSDLSEGGALLMSDEEAKEHREKLMQARSSFHSEADKGWHKETYSFCEH